MSQETIAPLSGAALRLTQFGVIRAAGAEAAKFLHSQLTQDFALLGDGQARLAGYCSAKGRLLATLVGWKSGPEELLLVLPVELLAPTLKRLSMFVMRAKCKLSDATAEFQLWGLAGAPASAWLGAVAPAQTWDLAAFNEGQVLRLPNVAGQAAGQARYLLALPATAPAPALPALSAADWQWLDVQSGLAWVQAATVEQFVPQMLNLELLGGVNFQKGCYPGQEVVARSQYRGTLKRRTFLFETAAPAQVGQEIFHSEDPGQPAGLVAAVAERDGRALLLAETKIAALEGGSLHLGAADGALLEVRPLPYELREPA
ncbi:folate-binding protein [Paucibacter sediminis]|uniref:Folate-binding protein n=1 Tax=Paucibacter sediminis TaxID=3019553 RepID=A0AA95SM80_9BURK|nr:folate-binding protein [Paucibacter sp. S2-9]WIT11107.1 folate-binding protein [Paucibacter sp. S2-9]